MPWLHKEEYRTVGEKLNLLYNKISSDSPAIFLSHAEVVGAQYGSEKGMAIANDVTIPLSLLQDRRLSYVALGHIHKHQVLSKPSDSPLVVYAGSPHRIDFGEEKEDKGVCLVTIDAKNKASFEFIKTDCRDFLTITVNIKGAAENPTKTVLDEIKKHDIKEKVVKVIINIPAECLEEIEMDKIKKALNEAHYVAGISRNVERVERQRSEETKDVETLTPVQALKKYFAAKKYSIEKQKLLEEFAAKLLDGQKSDYY